VGRVGRARPQLDGHRHARECDEVRGGARGEGGEVRGEGVWRRTRVSGVRVAAGEGGRSDGWTVRTEGPRVRARLRLCVRRRFRFEAEDVLGLAVPGEAGAVVHLHLHVVGVALLRQLLCRRAWGSLRCSFWRGRAEREIREVAGRRSAAVSAQEGVCA
jgi:hypothetical protein